MNNNQKSYQLIGIGNSIMDYFCHVSDDFLIKNSLVKGSMALIDKSQMTNLNQLSIEKFSSGGSVANTINNISQLEKNSDNFPIAFIGSIGSDLAGQQFMNDLKNNNIDYIGQINKNLDTASSFIFITPDGQRTMCTYLGCSPNIELKNINLDYLANCKILYIEGYLWDNPTTIETIKTIISLAKKQQCKIAFSLSDSFCVERNHQEFLELISRDIDILFANELEINKLCQISQFNSEIINNFIAKLNQNIILATTLSDKGCQIFFDKSYISIPTLQKKPIDTTGAGDSFASGFLYGLIKGLEINKCGEIGNIFAGKIIEKIGARFSLQETINLKDTLKL